MPLFICRVCGKEGYVKPSHQRIGYGKYCSQRCNAFSQRNGGTFLCHTCGRQVYRSKKFQQRSKSGKFFCSKSCQTVWRNLTFAGEAHANWKGGVTTYRKVLQGLRGEAVCERCHNHDTRVLIAHHKDRNRKNNSISNLIWLCHNCHYLVHHYKSESEDFVVPVA